MVVCQNIRALVHNFGGSMSIIEVTNLNKTFKIMKAQTGLFNSVKSLFYREYIEKQAVKNMNFQVNQGEIVGFIGPNGAGKSTTIKMLCGILMPTSGSITVNGMVPYKNRNENSKQIGVVFGQRSQLYWDLPVQDTFDVYQKLYDIAPQQYKKNKEFFIEVLQMQDFMNQPVRQLSLGQKMKANLALSMLHDPKILYLDEPTIGLDVISKRSLRRCIVDINKEKKTTIILTTHDMDDIETTCNRLILINQGEKLYDGDIVQFKKKYEKGYTIVLKFQHFPAWKNKPKFYLEKEENHSWYVTVDSAISTKSALLQLIEMYDPIDIQVREISIETVIEQIFS